MANSHNKTSVADTDTSARAASSPPARKAWLVAPNVPCRRPRVQFGTATLLVIMSIGGPIVAAALVLLPRDFYQLNFQLVVVVSVFCALTFSFSLCRPRWAFVPVVFALFVGIVAHVSVATDRFRLDEAATVTLLLVVWGLVLATGTGLVLSYARYDH